MCRGSDEDQIRVMEETKTLVTKVKRQIPRVEEAPKSGRIKKVVSKSAGAQGILPSNTTHVKVLFSARTIRRIFTCQNWCIIP